MSPDISDSRSFSLCFHTWIKQNLPWLTYQRPLSLLDQCFPYQIRKRVGKYIQCVYSWTETSAPLHESIWKLPIINLANVPDWSIDWSVTFPTFANQLIGSSPKLPQHQKQSILYHICIILLKATIWLISALFSTFIDDFKTRKCFHDDRTKWC